MVNLFLNFVIAFNFAVAVFCGLHALTSKDGIFINILLCSFNIFFGIINYLNLKKRIGNL